MAQQFKALRHYRPWFLVSVNQMEFVIGLPYLSNKASGGGQYMANIPWLSAALMQCGVPGYSP